MAVGTVDRQNPARPDVLLVVMDCVRAVEFPGGGPNPVSMPFVERLRRQGVTFPRATSVAPWTVPSHASMFTGLYPWEHGCHGRGTLKLSPRFERIASVLHGEGYQSISLSANPIISPFYGLVDGFDVANWGEWWEQINRLKATPYHTYRAVEGGRAPEVPAPSFRERTGRAVKTILTRFPSTLAVGDAVVRRAADRDGRRVGNMNPWIEPSLESWLAERPPGQPSFCFVNFLDAHEPYLLDPMKAESFAEWWRYMRIPQDVLALLAGDTPPSAGDLKRLHELYRQSIAGIDRRLQRIVEAYQNAGRWENTLFLLTSDHGQAFGEHGMIWHGVRTEEEMLRVPLIVRFPRGEFAGSSARGWATPMDIPPTILEAAGTQRTLSMSGYSLRRLVSEERPGPLFAAGDGAEWNRRFMAHLSPKRKSELNLFSIAAYQGTSKIVVDATTGEVRGFDLTADPPAELPRSRLAEPALASVIEEARRSATSLMHPTVSAVSAAVDERLRSWGYG
jgi:arylsulfatase A-like enzyme